MDTTKEYIDMCLKAVDIQKLDTYHWAGEGSELRQVHVLDKHSYYAVKDDKTKQFYYSVGFAIDYTSNCSVHGYINHHNLNSTFGCAVRDDLPVAYKWDEVIWLPRQDELQNILSDGLGGSRNTNSLLIELLHLSFNRGIGFAVGHTLEKLWLAFVMKDKYNKEWNGTDWVLQS